MKKTLHQGDIMSKKHSRNKKKANAKVNEGVSF